METFIHMKKKQIKEGKLKGCLGMKCKCTCCDDDEVEEWINEYLFFHDRIKDFIKSKGIEIEFVDDRVRFKKCSDGKHCKFLQFPLNKGLDMRPIDCKIYPFAVDWHTIDFDKKIVNILYCDNDCLFVQKKLIDDDFRKEVVDILRRDFTLLFYGVDFEFRFAEQFIDKKYERLHGWVK